MIQGEGLRETIRQERSAQRSLVVRQSRIGRLEAGIPFSLEATDDIDTTNQAHLAYPFHPHQALRIYLPFLMRVGE